MRSDGSRFPTVIGFTDLRMDMGLTPLVMPTEPEFFAAVGKIVGAAKRHNKPLAAFAMPAQLESLANNGFKMLAVASDHYILAMGVNETVEASRKLVATNERPARDLAWDMVPSE